MRRVPALVCRVFSGRATATAVLSAMKLSAVSTPLYLSRWLGGTGMLGHGGGGGWGVRLSCIFRRSWLAASIVVSREARLTATLVSTRSQQEERFSISVTPGKCLSSKGARSRQTAEQLPVWNISSVPALLQNHPRRARSRSPLPTGTSRREASSSRRLDPPQTQQR